jgi:tetratricopeptide (TPR) repeat protein
MCKTCIIYKAKCGAADHNETHCRWEPDAEARCEKLITEALLAAPNAPEPLQTLASIRISQTRLSEAKKALSDSMALWNELTPEDPSIPDFPTRISLARLLMEVGMEEDALTVVERLVSEDDQSVEAWYLGGWCLFLLGQKRLEEGKGTLDDDARVKKGHERAELHTASLVSSQEWLRQSLTLYEVLEYEDERLRDHALELVERLDGELEGCDVDDAGGWHGAERESESEEDEDGVGDEDEEMDGV